MVPAHKHRFSRQYRLYYWLLFCLCSEWGSTKTGEQKDLIVTTLNCVLKVPQYLPQERRFDIRVLVSKLEDHVDDQQSTLIPTFEKKTFWSLQQILNHRSILHLFRVKLIEEVMICIIQYIAVPLTVRIWMRYQFVSEFLLECSSIISTPVNSSTCWQKQMEQEFICWRVPAD